MIGDDQLEQTPSSSSPSLIPRLMSAKKIGSRHAESFSGSRARPIKSRIEIERILSFVIPEEVFAAGSWTRDRFSFSLTYQLRAISSDSHRLFSSYC